MLLILAACGSSGGGDSPQPKPAAAPAPKPAPDAAIAGGLSLAPVFPGYTFGYTGIVTPDAPRFGETTSTGVTVHDDQMGFHIWKGTIGDARTELEVEAKVDNSKYVETSVSPTEIDYTIGDHAGVVALVAGLLCGGEGNLDVYRKICSTLKKS